MRFPAILCSSLLIALQRRNVEGFSLSRVPVHSLSFMVDPNLSSTIKTERVQRGFVTALDAAKKRRRRRMDSGITDSSPDSTTPMENDEDDELPDFDLGAKEQLPELLNVERVEETAPPVLQQSTEPEMEESLISDDDPLVKEAMKASKNSRTFETPKELLRSRDRDLESTFEFEEVNTPLPRPGQQKSDSIGSSIPSPSAAGGKKRARAEARKAAAMEAAADEEPVVNADVVNDVLSYLPFYPKTKEGEEVTPLKVCRIV